MTVRFINTDTTTAVADTAAVTLANGDVLYVEEPYVVAGLGLDGVAAGSPYAVTTSASSASTDMVIQGDVFSAYADAIHTGSAAQNVTIGVQGSVISTEGDAIDIGADAAITGDIGTIDNAGIIRATAYALNIGGAGDVNNSGRMSSDATTVIMQGGELRNSGEITGDLGAIVSLGSTTLVNTATGVIDAIYNAVSINAASGFHSIVNRGEITATYSGITIGSGAAFAEIINSGVISVTTGAAIQSGANQNTIVNSGLIVGAVYFSDGAGNLYDGAQGRVAGGVIGASSTDTLIGGDHVDWLFGGGGDDSLSGGDGADSLDGGGGDYPNDGVDTLEGGDGSDRYLVDNMADQVHEDVGEGVDRVFTISDYRLGADQEIEWLIGRHQGIQGLAFTLTGLSLTGNEFDNHVVGLEAGDLLRGADGNDTLDGGEGADRMRGGEGDDRYYVDDADDEVREVGGDGADRVLTSVNYTLGAGQEIEKLTTDDVSSINGLSLTGNEFDNVLVGNAGDNRLDGGVGDDTMKALDGDDRYYVDSAGDVVREASDDGYDRVLSSVSYTLAEGQSIERLQARDDASTQSMTLIGNEIANSIYGNAGQNVLNGGGASDTLDGLGGRDAYLFDTELDGSFDTIMNFTVSTGSNAQIDKIRLDDDIFTKLTGSAPPGTALAAANFVNNTATTATQYVIYNTTTGALFYDDDGNGAHAAVQFATLNGHPAGVTAADFLIVS